MARRGQILLAAALAVALMAGCAETPPQVAPTLATPEFSGERAFSHLERLAGIGPRVAGEEGGELAWAYIREQLEALGLEIVEQEDEFEPTPGAEPVKLRNLVGVVPGESTDLVVLAAPFDSQKFEDFRFLGANDGASGAALLLELARTLASKPLPYTTWFVFLSHEAPLDPEQDDLFGFLGSRLLVNQLTDAGRLQSVRVAVYFNQVADAELRIAKDLRSHRQYRGAFFDAARRLGYGEAFPPDGEFGQPPGGHVAFYTSGLRRVVLVTDDRFGGNEAPGTYSHTEQDDLAHCSAQSLEIVGRTSEMALRDISATLTKIDRFARRPVVPDVEPAPEAETEPEEAGESADEGSGQSGPDMQVESQETDGAAEAPTDPPVAEASPVKTGEAADDPSTDDPTASP